LSTISQPFYLRRQQEERNSHGAVSARSWQRKPLDARPFAPEIQAESRMVAWTGRARRCSAVLRAFVAGNPGVGDAEPGRDLGQAELQGRVAEQQREDLVLLLGAQDGQERPGRLSAYP
jgi:hypothetical protein